MPEDYLTAQARALHDSPVAIEAWVNTHIGIDPSYTGLYRGAIGTLWAGSGDATDRAALLDGLLAHTGVLHRIVAAPGGAIGVETRAGSGWTWAGPGPNPGGRLAPASLATTRSTHTLTVALLTTPRAGGRTIEESVTFPDAELSARHLRMSYESRGGHTYAVLSSGTPGMTDGTGTQGTIVLRSRADVSGAVREELAFRFGSPGGTEPEVRRELFTREFSEFPSLFDPANRYDITVTTGWVPGSTLKSEDAWALWAQDAIAARDTAVAYTFLTQSDADTAHIMATEHVSADVTVPRITIVSDEVVQNAPNGARSVSLDLRHDAVSMQGMAEGTETAIAFQSVRSIRDASLEDGVLETVTGESAWSAMSAIAGSLSGAGPSDPVDRMATLDGALNRMLGPDERDGSTFTVSPQANAAFTVTFTTVAGKLRTDVSAPVAKGLTGATGEDAWILGNPSIGTDQIERAAADTEVALATSAHLASNWTAQYRYGQAKPPHWWQDSRQFQLGPAPSGSGQADYFEEQVLPTTDGSWAFDAIGYWDSINSQFYADGGHESTITVSADDVRNAHTFTEWFASGTDSTSGRTWDAISTSAYHELVTKGSTVLQYTERDGSVTGPIRFYLESHPNVTMIMNNKSFSVPAIEIRGTPDVPGVKKPVRGSKGWSNPDLTDNADNSVINTQYVLADPGFPIFVTYDTFIQSEIPGTVVDATTGQGVDGATVSVTGPNVSAVSWPGGSFDLPLFTQPFDKFEVTVSAPGYQPYDQVLDFRLASTLPLHVSLTPVPGAGPPATWVDASNESSVLGGLPLTGHSKAIIAEAIRLDPAKGVLVPTATIDGPAGPIDAWLEVDTSTGATYGVAADGLYGSTGRVLMACAGAVAKNYAKSVVTGGAPSPTKVPGCAVSYLAGRIAAWYLYAAGALDTVAAQEGGANLSLAQFHKRAIAIARELAKVYQSWALTGAGLAGVVNNGAFQAGLADGLDWADHFYGEAFGAG